MGVPKLHTKSFQHLQINLAFLLRIKCPCASLHFIVFVFSLIDVQEFTEALRTLGEPIDEEDISEMMKLGEKDKNNKISLYGKH